MGIKPKHLCWGKCRIPTNDSMCKLRNEAYCNCSYDWSIYGLDSDDIFYPIENNKEVAEKDYTDYLLSENKL